MTDYDYDEEQDSYDPSYADIIDDDQPTLPIEVPTQAMTEPDKHNPSWRDYQAPFEHSVEFVDSNGNKNIHTMRGSDLDEVLVAVRKFNAFLAANRARRDSKPSEQSNPVPSVGRPMSSISRQEPEDVSEDEEDSPEYKPCPVHPDMKMKRRPSKDGGYFYSHQVDGSWCNGRARR